MRFLTVLAVCIVTASGPSPAAAQQSPSLPSNSAATESVKAKALLMRMADYLAKAQSFSVTMDASFDVVQPSGQKIEFDETRKLTLSRPDKLRIDDVEADGDEHQLRFDGQDLVLFSPKEKVLGKLTRPGSVDEIIYYIVSEMQTRLPLSLLLVTSIAEELQKRVSEISLVEHATVDGKPTDHLAARTEDLDFQVWIATGDVPVPLRVVITYKKDAGQPQFRATLSEWNFNPKIDPASFTFVPPAGTERVAFMVPATGKPGLTSEGK
ncbi:hypothetical protein SAMN02990966_05878 [Rhodospirillales bacterium URHD0017]|nr:hypothetical protein SAMN02990966_05878 [Rhodospirillales bacterium URHD0017]